MSNAKFYISFAATQIDNGTMSAVANSIIQGDESMSASVEQLSALVSIFDIISLLIHLQSQQLCE